MKKRVEQFTSLGDQSGSACSPVDLLAAGADAVVGERRASVPLLQRRLALGYTEALRLLASLAGAGVVE